MKRLLALLLSLVLMISAVPATAEDLNWLPFEATLCDIVFEDIAPSALFEEDLHHLIACFLLIEYASAYDDSAANYCSTEGCYVGYLEDAYWCEFLDETNETILSIIYTPGSNAEAALASSHGLSNALSLQASLMADTLTTYREVTISEMSDAFNVIVDLLSDE